MRVACLLRFYSGAMIPYRHLFLSLMVPALLWVVPPAAATEPAGLVVGTGVEGGSFWNAGQRLRDVAQEMGLEIEMLASEGSLENIDELLDEDNAVNLAFVQADALQLHFNRYPRDRRKIEILEKIGQQCLFVAARLKSGFDEVDDLQDAGGVQVGVDFAATDVSLSIDYINSRDDQFETAEVVYGNFEVLADEVYRDAQGADVLVLLSGPRNHAEHLRYVLDNPHRYQLLDFESDLLAEPLPDGRKIYREIKLALPGLSKPMRTLCVSGLLVANREKLPPRARNRLTDLVSYHWMRVYSTRR